MIAFFADLFRNGPELLPKGERPGKSWFPTITMTASSFLRCNLGNEKLTLV